MNRLNVILRVFCAGILVYFSWKNIHAVEVRRALRFPQVPPLGEGAYGMGMVGTIGEIIEREGLRDVRMAVWGGEKAKAHDLPFRFRVTADRFLLPAKGVPVVATPGEAANFEYILSPWRLGKRLNSAGRHVELVTDENRVWLYRITPSKGTGE
jgi:hypothetical protein